MPDASLLLAALFELVSIAQLMRLARGVERIGAELTRLRKVAEGRIL